MRWTSICAAGAIALAGCGQFGAGGDSAGEATGATGQGLGSGGTDDAGGKGAAGGNVLRLGETNLCAAAAGASNGANQNVVLATCATSTRQLWLLDNEMLALGDGRCLMAPAAQLKRLGAVLVACGKVSTQQGRWRFDGNQLRLSADASRCLMAEQTSAGTLVNVVACEDGNAGQLWALQDAAAVTAQPSPNDGNGAAQTPNATDANAVAAQPAVTLDVNTATNDTSNVGGSPRSYSGPAINFPNDPNRWQVWDSLWTRASRAFPSSNTAAQNGWINDAIALEAALTGMDPRFILAVIMQESGGDVHVRTTNNGVNNPGLMQSHNGASFSDSGDGGKASIFQMVQDGVEGTKDGDGLIQGVRQTKNYFAAGRLYNSGQIDNNNLSNAMGATGSYCQDLANRVMGRM